jgi:ankyrin repeat protein
MKNLIIIGLMSATMFGATAGIMHNVAEDIKPSQLELLEQAIHTNVYQTVSNMLGNGLDINTEIEGDGSLLIMAIQAGRETMVYNLIDAGADVNQAVAADGNPLINAAMTNNVRVAQRLFDEGALVDAIVEHDETALINASRMGHFDMVKFLVENGADVNLGLQVKTIKGNVYRSPLNGAKTAKIRDYLLKMGAKV